MQTQPHVLVRQAFVLGALIGSAASSLSATTASVTGARVLGNYYPDANYDLAESAAIGAAGGAIVGAFTNAYYTSLSVFQPASVLSLSSLVALYLKICAHNALECTAAAALGYLLVVNSDNHKMNFGQHMAANATGAGILFLFLPILRGLLSICVEIRQPRYAPAPSSVSTVHANPPSALTTAEAPQTHAAAHPVADTPSLSQQSIFATPADTKPEDKPVLEAPTSAIQAQTQDIEHIAEASPTQAQAVDSSMEVKSDEEPQNNSCRIM